jgi:hypothetical protein
MIQIDIEMPKYCYDCPCHNGENGRCNIIGDSTYDKRPFDCPLKEVKSKKDDLISRQVAIDAIRASTSKYTGFMGMEMYTDNDAVEAINGVPSAQPEKEIPKRVLWSGWKGTRYTRYNCPNCTKPVKNDDVYCHRCGQKLMFPKISFTPYVPGEKQELIVRWDDEE